MNEDEAKKLRSEAGRMLGSIRTEKKAANARRAATFPRKKPENIHCECAPGKQPLDSLDWQEHKKSCLRGRALKRRAQSQN